jgi:hypothetical protein
MYFEKVSSESINRIDLNQVRDKCHIVVNVVLKILLP